MLQITVPPLDGWDEENQVFVKIGKEQTLQLEHSLVSLAKWESKWCKAFLSKREKTDEEVLDYIKCMTLTQNVNPEVYSRLTEENMREINAYIEAPMTATYFAPEVEGGKSSGEQVTAELIYYWMIALTIPVKFEKWHLNRLLALIKVCNIKNQPPKKMSRREILNRQAAINKSRRQKYNTKG